MLRDTRGFTLLVVGVITGILAAISVTSARRSDDSLPRRRAA